MADVSLFLAATIPVMALLGVRHALDIDHIAAMEELQRNSGFAGRSELVRAAARLLLAENRERASLAGEINGLLVVTHDQEREQPVTELKHKFEDIVRTHLHSKTTSSVCVELFLVHGPAKKVAEMSKSFQAEDKMKSARFIPI